MSRYAAHHALARIGVEGQQRICESRVILIGLGGLGCPAAQYLVGSGVSELQLCDFDTVSESNLARQLLYTPADTGRLKVEAAAERLASLNPKVTLLKTPQRIDQPALMNMLAGIHLVIDASDNYGTRLAVNRACLKASVPWVMGSCIRMEGQIMVLNPADSEQACYRCVYGSAPEHLEDCPGAGVFAPVAGMTGTAMAQVALTRLAGLTPPGGFFLLDAELMQWQRLNTTKDPHCPDCGPTRTID